MHPDTITELSKAVPSQFHQALFQHCDTLMNMSYDQMQRHYSEWDKHADTVAGFRARDKEDARAGRLGEPEKMTVPLTQAQLHTFAAFLFLFYQQSRHAFE